MVINVTNKDFFIILKLDLNALECRFLCVIHGPQKCMKWMKRAFRWWNFCFHMIAWYFNSVVTIQLFLWEKIAPFGCGEMARLWIQTTGFGVSLSQSLNNSSGHLSNTQRHRKTIEICFLMAKYTRCFQKTNQCQNSIVRDENACFPACWMCLKIFFACKLKYLKQSLIWCHFHSTQITTEEFLYPTHCLLNVCFQGMCIWDTVMAKLGMGIINNDSWFMGIKNRKIWAKFYRI